jgi:ATP-dependent Lhr-like helicase
MLAGRWSLVSSLLRGVASPTERAHARAVMLLERWGVLSRDAAGLELLPGGFASVYPVLGAMEESGRLRRGHFALGLSGAQFAYAGIVDRLRTERALPREPVATLLAATDPANPYGGILPWPGLRRPGCGSARRAVGSRVVAVNGVPVLYLEAEGRSLLSFEAASDPELLSHAARALGQLVAGGRRRSLRVQRIDSEVADRAELTEALVQVGFRRDYNALVLEREAGTLIPG